MKIIILKKLYKINVYILFDVYTIELQLQKMAYVMSSDL